MPIRVRQSPEPFTKDAERQPPLFVSSAGYRRLHTTLRRYLRREIAGRSFLISGHRGSGKTTLVLQAIWNIVRSPQAGELAPLLVRLQGPDLLPDPELLSPAAAAAKSAGEVAGDGGEATAENAGTGAQPKPPPAADGAGKPADTAPKSLTERALRQITIAIYRAASQAFAEAFARRMGAAEATDGPAVDELPRAERAELAARFRLALDEAPSPAVLRELYRLGGVLERGVLPAAGPPGPVGRGVRELAALASAAAAFRVVSGKVVSSRKESDSATEERSRSFSLAPSTKDLAEKALALLLGGGVGAAALAGDTGPAVAVVVGVATAVAAGGVLKLSGSRTRKRSASEEYTFLPAHDASTLERELPVLIGRLAEAGLAPVFVVDELDKVEGLQERMRTVVSQLKQFVSERAFFCFLTDRDYFEHLRDRALREPYPHEHTYFTDHLFVLYRPGDLHEYLDKVLAVEGTMAEEEIDKELLRFLLLHRSKMHPVDLRRELHRMTDAEGNVGLGRRPVDGGTAPPTSSPALGLQLAVMIQLAIEWLLARDPLRDRLEHDPHFAQPVYDALYYLSRTWEQGEGGGAEDGGDFDLSAEAFRSYMAARMNPNRPPPSKPAPGRAGGAAGDPPISIPLSARDRDFLLDEVRKLLHLLLDPESLKRQLDLEPLGYISSSAARDAIPTREPILVRVGEDRFAFRFDPYGRPLELTAEVAAEVSASVPATDEGLAPAALAPQEADGAEKPPPARRPRARRPGGAAKRGPREPAAAPTPVAEKPALSRDELRRSLELVHQLDDFVYELVGMNLSTLATIYVLSAVPTWSQFQEAVGRLRPYLDEGTTYAELAQDMDLVASWVDDLEQRSSLLAASLVYATALGRALDSPHELERRTRGLAALVEGLRYHERRSRTVLQAELERYRETVGGLYEAHADWPSLTEVDLAAWKAWVTAAVKSRTTSYDPNHVRLASETAWRSWKERLEKRAVIGRVEIHVTEADLLCRIAGVPPATELDTDLDGMTLRDWSNAFARGCDWGRVPDQVDAVTWGLLVERPRAWLAVTALLELGLAERVEALLKNVPRFDDDEVGEVRSWLRRIQQTRPRALEPRPWGVIVSEGDELPVSAAWKPSGRFGALSLPAQSLPPLWTYLAIVDTPVSPIWLIEMPSGGTPEALFGSLRPMAADSQPIFLLVHHHERERSALIADWIARAGHPVGHLGAPGSLDEAMEVALRLQKLPT